MTQQDFKLYALCPPRASLVLGDLLFLVLNIKCECMLRCVDPMLVDIDIEVHGNLKSALRRRIKKLDGFLYYGPTKL